jgi:hypothetical protein
MKDVVMASVVRTPVGSLMKRRGAGTGLVTLCVGGGYGVTMIVKQWGA